MKMKEKSLRLRYPRLHLHSFQNIQMHQFKIGHMTWFNL